MNNIIARILGVGKVIWEFLVPIIKTSLASTLTALLPIALEVVASLATSGKNGTEKRETAVKQLQQIAVAEGIHAAESAVRLAVEMAYTKLKSES